MVDQGAGGAEAGHEGRTGPPPQRVAQARVGVAHRRTHRIGQAGSRAGRQRREDHLNAPSSHTSNRILDGYRGYPQPHSPSGSRVSTLDHGVVGACGGLNPIGHLVA